MATELTPDKVTETLWATLKQDVICVPEEDGLRLDTPYVLQDGHSLRVYLYPSDQNGAVIVSDGGFAAELIEMLSPSPSVLSQNHADMKQIARELGIEWDIDFSYQESTLERAIQRLVTLARAVDRSLSLIQPPLARESAVGVEELPVE